MNTPLHSPEETELLRHARRRARRFWIWLGLLPGLLTVPLFWLLVALDAVPHSAEWLPWAFSLAGLCWVGFCTSRIAATFEPATPARKLLKTAGVFLLLAGLDTALIYGMMFASCLYLLHNWR